MNLEEHNLREIEGLSQRGRTLSIVDLINANTLSVDMAAYSLYAMANGASLLTGARPGNAGKTTLMACLLTFLPPGVRIVTTSNPSVVTEAQRFIDEEGSENLCFLCHEIGSGHWYGYLWGQYVGQLLHLMSRGCRVASCIHADTLTEMHDILVSRELGVSEEDFARLGLILFMKLERKLMGYRRRVATFYGNSDEIGKHGLLFTWEPGSDTFNQHGLPTEHAAEKIEQCRSFVESLMVSGKTDFRWVREQVANFYSEDPTNHSQRR
jgi:hypothetical protein